MKNIMLTGTKISYQAVELSDISAEDRSEIKPNLQQHFDRINFNNASEYLMLYRLNGKNIASDFRHESEQFADDDLLESILKFERNKLYLFMEGEALFRLSGDLNLHKLSTYISE